MNGSKKYLVVKTDLSDNTTDWNTAMTKCPADEGWRLPSMNDLRQILKIAGWDTTPYLTPGSTEYDNAFKGKSYTYDATPEGTQFGYNGAITSSSFFYYNTNYWTSDTNPDNSAQAGYLYAYGNGSNIQFNYAGKTTSYYRVRCIKDWN